MSNLDLDTLSLGELMQLYAFVSADADRTFGVNQQGKVIVRTKLAEIRDALYRRIYGMNPFVSITIEGEVPEKIDLSKFDPKAKPQTIVVHDGQKPAIGTPVSTEPKEG